MKKLFKLLKIVVIILLSIFILISIGLFILIKTFDANKYKPQIIQAITQTIKRQVDISDIALKFSFNEGLNLQIKDFKLIDDPAFGVINLVEIPQLNASVNIIDFIIKRQFSVADITINSPKITIIKNALGIINFQALIAETATTQQTNKPLVLPAIFINSFKIENATVAFKDKTYTPELLISANQLNFTIKNLSLGKPFDILLQAAIFSSQQNINATAKISLNLIAKEFNISSMQASIDLGLFSLEQISHLPTIKPSQLPDTLAGKITLDFLPMTITEKGLGQFKVNVNLTDGILAAAKLVPGLAFTIKKINANIKDFSLESGVPFEIEAKMQYLSNHPNISITGQASIDPIKTSAKINNGNITVDLTNFSLNEFKTNITAFKDLPLPSKVEGAISLFIAQADISTKGLEKIAAKAKLIDGFIKLDQISGPLSKINSVLSLTENNLTIENFNANLGNGIIQAKGIINDYLLDQSFAIEGEVKDIELAEILDQSKTQIKVNGLLLGNFKADGKIKDLKSIESEGNIELKTVVLKDFNILKNVLDKISFLPNVSQLAKNSLSEKYAAKLENANTQINSVKSTYILSEGICHIEPIMVTADEFNFSGKADADLTQSYSVDGNLTIPIELSAAMAKKVEELKYLYDNNNCITIPIHVTGQGAQQPNIKVDETAKQIGKTAIVNKGAEEINKLINKYTGQENSSQKNEDAVKNILNKILQ